MNQRESGQRNRNENRREQERDRSRQSYAEDAERRRKQRQARRRKRERELRRQKRILAAVCCLGAVLVIALAAAGIRWLRSGKDAGSGKTQTQTAAEETLEGNKTAAGELDSNEDSAKDADSEDSGENTSGTSAYCSFAETSNTVQLKDSLTDISIYDAQRGITSTSSSVSDSEGTAGQSSESSEEGDSSEEEASDTSKEEAAKAADYVDSQYAILVNATTGEILAERRAFERMVPASMTKVMTLLVAVEAMENPEENLKDTVTITQEICDESYLSGSSFVGYGVGDTATVEDLLYGAILPSGADAAMALAEYTAGSQEAFAELMNQKAEELGIAQTTHFTNCVGLYNEDHYSTVYDMCIIMKAAVDNELCKKILSAHTWTTGALKDNPNGTEISNWFLRRIEDHDTAGTVLCGKTGFVNESGNCAVSYEEGNDGNDYIVCTGLTYNLWRCIYDHVALYKEYT